MATWWSGKCSDAHSTASPPQGGEVDAGAGVGGEDVVLPRPRGPPAPRPPVSGGLPHRVHLRGPVAGAVAREVALPALYGCADVQEVAGERPAVPLEVAHDPAGSGVPAYRFDDSHLSPPPYRKRAGRPVGVAMSDRMPRAAASVSSRSAAARSTVSSMSVKSRSPWRIRSATVLSAWMPWL